MNDFISQKEIIDKRLYEMYKLKLEDSEENIFSETKVLISQKLFEPGFSLASIN